jgi:hypothetical protein
LADVSWDLSETAKDKLAGLAESVEFESEESYKQKLNILKESFIGASEQNEEILHEANEPVEPTLYETHGSHMDAYARAIGRTIR